jgi:ubiquinol-cytochrome c reductase iron-sulfur subunit
MKDLLLLTAAAAALACAATAALHANPAIPGWLAALAFAAIAGWAGAAARELHASGDLTEPRHPLSSAPGAGSVTRGGAFGRAWLVALSAFGVAALVPLVSLGRRPVARTSAWTRGARLVTPEGVPLRPDDVAVGGVETVFPEHRIDAPESAVLLIRVEDGAVSSTPDRRDWTPRGNVAYSKICTHAGCPVAIYRHADYTLYCPCHQSEFDVLFGARPIAGPATRALPQLGLAVDRDGFLVARGDFDAPVGPDRWDRPA